MPVKTPETSTSLCMYVEFLGICFKETLIKEMFVRCFKGMDFAERFNEV
jgi:hypothetical protein